MDQNVESIIPDFSELPEIEVELSEEDLQDKEIQSTDETVETDTSEEDIQETEEEEEVEEEVEEETTSEEDDDPLLKQTVERLRNSGVLQFAEGDIDSWEKIEEQLENLPQLAVNTILSQAPELTQKIIQYSFTKGADLTKEDLKSFITTYLEDISTQDYSVSNVDEAKSFLHQYYKDSLPKAAIDAAIETLEDEDENGQALIDRAKKLADKVKSESKADKLIEDAQTKNRQKIQDRQKFINRLKQDLDQSEWKPARKQKVAEFITSGEANRILSSAAASSTKALIQLANLATFWDEAKGEFNLDAFKDQMFAKQAKSLKDSITRNSFSSKKETKEKTKAPNTGKLNLDSLQPIFD